LARIARLEQPEKRLRRRLRLLHAGSWGLEKAGNYADFLGQNEAPAADAEAGIIRLPVFFFFCLTSNGGALTST
jgi:hypothetical protein